MGNSQVEVSEYDKNLTKISEAMMDSFNSFISEPSTSGYVVEEMLKHERCFRRTMDLVLKLFSVTAFFANKDKKASFKKKRKEIIKKIRELLDDLYFLED